MPSTDVEPKPLVPHPTLPAYYAADRDRQRFVNGLFDRGSRYYDRVEGVLSFGSGRWYRGEVLRRAGLQTGMRVLDVATGTGPVAATARQIVGDDGLVVGLDPSRGMLMVASRKVDGCFVQAIGEALAVRSNEFDLLTMGYALRHVADLREAFREYHRVLKPGGQLAIMELSVPRSKPARWLLGLYMNRFVPFLVRLGTRSRDAADMVHYYWETTATCVPPDTILEALSAAGFRDVRRHTQFGMLSDYHATKP